VNGDVLEAVAVGPEAGDHAGEDDAMLHGSSPGKNGVPILSAFLLRLWRTGV
jgi:hypothetical protein